MSCKCITHNYLEYDNKNKKNPYRSFPLLPDRYRTTIRSKLTTVLLNSERLLLRLYSDILHVVFDAVALGDNLLRSRSALAAENLFLRKQLTFFVERDQTPHRTDNTTRFTMVILSRLFDWRDALVVVKPDTPYGQKTQPNCKCVLRMSL